MTLFIPAWLLWAFGAVVALGLAAGWALVGFVGWACEWAEPGKRR